MTAVFSIIFIVAIAIFTLGMTVTDTIWRKIPNKYTFPFAAAGLIYSIVLWVLCRTGCVAPLDYTAQELGKLGAGNFDVMFTYLSQITPLWALAGFVVGFFILFLPAAFGGVGFGDVKLLAALGIWLGVKWFLLVFCAAIFIACFLSVCVMIAQGPTRMLRRMRNMKKFGTKEADLGKSKGKNKKRRHRDNPKELKRIIPFAIPVAMASILFLFLFVTNTFQNVPIFYK